MFTETVEDKLAYDDWLDMRQSSDRLIRDSQIRAIYDEKFKFITYQQEKVCVEL